MKKIININLSGRVIPIEDSAYESLQRYIESLRRYFANEEGRDEIINDIESRIAELMNEKIKKGNTSVTDADIEEIISSMGRIEDFEEVDAESATASERTSNTYTQSEPRKTKGRLYRDGTDKLVGGVCSGIANYMNFDPAIVRLLFAIITFGGFGMGILIYILLWIILPVRNLDTYLGKRLFRNPDDRILAGVAGGLSAYFNKPAWVVRLIFAAPLVLNIAFGLLNGLFFAFHRDIFPNLFIGSFTGTFILAYIILWIVLPEAKSPFEKMEMRGEKVDVNRIRQNVKDEMETFKSQAQSVGEEVKATAQAWTKEAKEFASTRGKVFAGEVAESARPVARSIGHVIGVLFKAFFIFIAGVIALSLFGLLMVIIFGGVAWWPINDFLWSSPWQKLLGWGTLLLFITVPVIGFLVWLVRRMVRARSRNRYLGWIFGGLWVIGWVCAITFAASIAKDLRAYDRTVEELPLTQPKEKLIVEVDEPQIRYTGNIWWMETDNNGWDIAGDTMKYNNVKIRVAKSTDSLYHVKLYKYSAGKNIGDAQNRADKIQFHVISQDSLLKIGSGLAIDKGSKFRGQGIIMEIQIPEGKQISFDESVKYAFNPFVIRRYEKRGYERYWGSRNYYKLDWDNDEYFNWDTGVDYVMTSGGRLVPLDEAIKDKKGVHEVTPTADSLRIKIEERDRQNELDRQKLEEIENKKMQSTTKKSVYNKQGAVTSINNLFAPLII